MIRKIKGKVEKIEVKDKYDLVEVMTEGGVGYGVHMVGAAELSPEESVELFTTMVVREDSQTLYGFIDHGKRGFFERLIEISGIGPKIALAVMGRFSVEEVMELVGKGDFGQLKKVSGLGEKGAKKIIIELQGELDMSEKSSGNRRSDKLPEQLAQLRDGLTSLGFRGDELEGMLEKGKQLYDGDRSISVEQLLSAVLRER